MGILRITVSRMLMGFQVINACLRIASAGFKAKLPKMAPKGSELPENIGIFYSSRIFKFNKCS